MKKSRDSLGLFAVVLSVAIVAMGFFTFIGRDEEISFNIVPQIAYNSNQSDVEQLALEAEKLNEMAPAAGPVATLPANHEIEQEIFGF